MILSGLANEFIQYFTTPEEYDRQHYEGGSTLYGPLSAPFLQDQLIELTSRLSAGQPAQAPYAFDSTNGVTPDGPAYGSGAGAGSLESSPGTTRRLGTGGRRMARRPARSRSSRRHGLRDGRAPGRWPLAARRQRPRA